MLDSEGLTLQHAQSHALLQQVPHLQAGVSCLVPVSFGIS
jgi:hypothetical protein